MASRKKRWSFHRASYELAKSAQVGGLEVASLKNIGHDLTAAGRPQEGLEYLQQGLEIAREGGYRHDEAFLLLNMATAHGELGERDRALEEYLGALELSRELGPTTSEPTSTRCACYLFIRPRCY